MKTHEENQALAKRIFHYYKNVVSNDKSATVRHFMEEGIWKSSIYHIINRCADSESANFKPLPGPKPSKITPNIAKKLKATFTKDPSTTVRNVAVKLNLARSTISDFKVHTLGMKAFVKKKVPKYSEAQEKRAKTNSRKIYEKQTQKVLVIDDETYMNIDPTQTPGKKFFHAKSPDDVEYKKKTIPKSKFPKKFMIWQAMDDEGHVSPAYVSDGTLNSETYLNECVKHQLVPFINLHHDIKDILFWPDMSSVHYATKVTEYMRGKNINFVEKSQNTPNIPQARGIETFWALCKEKYSKLKKQPSTITGFCRIWKKISEEVAKNSGKGVMQKAARNLRQIGCNGVAGLKID